MNQVSVCFRLILISRSSGIAAKYWIYFWTHLSQGQAHCWHMLNVEFCISPWLHITFAKGPWPTFSIKILVPDFPSAGWVCEWTQPDLALNSLSPLILVYSKNFSLASANGFRKVVPKRYTLSHCEASFPLQPHQVSRIWELAGITWAAFPSRVSTPFYPCGQVTCNK